mgnify:CR=1 FL=1
MVVLRLPESEVTTLFVVTRFPERVFMFPESELIAFSLVRVRPEREFILVSFVSVRPERERKFVERASTLPERLKREPERFKIRPERERISALFWIV